ncbi:MAG: energy transducer TonB [Crocinitomicaceae bacterium TMED114]|nr:MAG: energy transducer TonB [Crocinitomicaceae bacterium TMED114]
MIRFTRNAFGLSAMALSLSLLTACAEGKAPSAQEEETPTPGEVISAEFPGGAAKVMEFIAGEVTYPESAKADGVEGKVFVEFTIAETGAVTNVMVKKPLHPALDSAAIAAAEAMPAWSPAMKDGQPVATTITLPIFFKQ